ncbi:hypothetical protein ALMA_1229 [Alloscardovia macacae]|uniref:Uncharacterized protein n=1 Tax=Alloscardovia macacae TaxID=1160091 RepID=A0A261F3H4_9BIFI|nr:hypothetical protein ALMA_1229 [Alloscardovia macacae]
MDGVYYSDGCETIACMINRDTENKDWRVAPLVNIKYMLTFQTKS